MEWKVFQNISPHLPLLSSVYVNEHEDKLFIYKTEKLAFLVVLKEKIIH